MWIRCLIASFMEACHSPRGRLILLSMYYLAIIFGLVLLYGKGDFTSADFVYQGF
jgi:hypothetical protein